MAKQPVVDIHEIARDLLAVGFSKMNAARHLSTVYSVPLPQAIGVVEAEQEDAPECNQLGEGQPSRP